MVSEKEAANPDEAKRMLQDDYDKRRKVVKDSLDPKLQPVTKPGTGYTPWNFFAEIQPPELLDGDDKNHVRRQVGRGAPTRELRRDGGSGLPRPRQQGVAGVHYVNMRCAGRAVHTFVLIGASSSIHEGHGIDHKLDL